MRHIDLYIKLEIKYLDQNVFNCFNPGMGDIYNLTVHQFEKLLKKEGYVKFKINLENEDYIRLLEHFTKKL